MGKVTVISVDLAKNSFAVMGLDKGGREVWRKTRRRQGLMRFLVQQPACTVVMEACGGAHHWARELTKLGHEVQLLSPQHVKPYRRGQKNDYNDARAIADAFIHGDIRPVAVKGLDQQDGQTFHRLRRQLMNERTRLINQARGLLAEYGVVLAQGEPSFRRRMPALLEASNDELTPRCRELLARQYARYRALNEELAWYDRELKQQARDDETCRRLTAVPGFGPVVASVFSNWIGDGQQFQRGRHASAALGLVPRQHSTGGRHILLGISKRGDAYLRSLVVHGARAVVSRAPGKDDSLSRWINRLVATRGFNRAVVALANKMVRRAWVVIARGEQYQPQPC